MKSEAHPALTIFASVQNRYPNAWSVADDLVMRFTSGKHGDGCIFSDGEGQLLSMRLQGDVPEPAIDPILFGALVSWRPTKGIYRFHPALYEALVNSELEGEIPSSLLLRMPGYAVYIETPPTEISIHLPMEGFFAYLSRLGKHQDTLQLIAVARCKDSDLYEVGCVYSLPLGNHPVSDLVSINFTKELLDKTPEVRRVFERNLSGMLSLLLYLCSEQPEIQGWTPPQVKTMFLGSKRRLIAAKETKTWDVGLRIGAALDLALKDCVDTSEGSSGSGISVRPHIRRAHWHSFWVGKRGEQSLSLRWLPPIAVKTKESDKLPAVIHPVQE